MRGSLAGREGRIRFSKGENDSIEFGDVLVQSEKIQVVFGFS